ncbi:hypothetical protein [Streptomyces avermitilis]|uniref:hypothetical protein n=1 Tax=Streptomyces avermitilis TaxID=33903 RepID=UPI00367F6C02
MSRTVHHVPTRHRTHPAHWPTGTAGPCTAHTLTDHRYSRQELARAHRAGRRPVPTRADRSFAAYVFPRAVGAHFWSPYESAARADLRTFRTTACKLLRAAPPGTLLTAAEDLDHPPTRHRHRDLW